MASSGEKKWNRPWSMEEMIDNAENWSLAGDVALLNTLKDFSENLFSKTVNISDNVDNLLHSLDEVSLKLSLSQNEFQSLRNTQFIESRVYEDDETLDLKEEVKPEPKAPTDEDKEKSMRESVMEGLRVMDRYFEKVEVSISDSEDEETSKSYILRPKDLYADRLLPLVIGSEEWYKKWHVGLASTSSESESEKVSETYSDSESGDDLPKDLIKGSETSSELDFSSQTSGTRPVANSTFNDTAKKPSEFASDEESDGQGSVPVKAPISSKSFAEQLAAKLGDVVSERGDVSPEINRKPIQPAQTNKFAGDLFSDEPPPLDDLEDTILPKSAQQGLFSGGRGLFDDNEDDLFWGQRNEELIKAADGAGNIEKGNAPMGDQVAPPSKTLPKLPQASKGPFDTDSESSDDELFSTKRKPSVKQPFLKPYSTAAPLFDEEPPELDTYKKPLEEKKKPVGGVSIFGKSDIFSGGSVENVQKPRQRDQPDAGKVETEPKEPISRILKPATLSEEGPVTVPATADPKPQKISLFDDEERAKPLPTSKAKKISLFDDDDDLFKDDLFSGVGTNKLSSNLFNDVSEGPENLFSTNISKNDTPKVDLFADLADVKVDKKSAQAKPKKTMDLFDADGEEDDLFDVKPTPPSATKVFLSDVEKPQKTEVSEQFFGDQKDEVDKSSEKNVDKLLKRQVIGAENLPTEPKVAKGLFDDVSIDTDGEELFKEPEARQTQHKSDLFEGQLSETESEPKQVFQPPPDKPKQDTSNVTEKSQTKSTINLFGSSPPPDDDDWDSKSGPSSDEDQFSYRLDYNTAGSSLFDNEPPSLGPNDSSGIVRDENITRVDTDESSFNPYASSSRRLSSEVYNEQQSQDSFFVTKNRTESIGVPPSLDKIPETETSSNLDITPSGNFDDLDDSKDSSVFQDNPQHSQMGTSKKTISLFDEEFEDDDLFSSISKGGNTSKLSDKRLSLFDNIDNVLEESVEREDTKSEEKQGEAKAVKEGKETETSVTGNSVVQNDPQQSQTLTSRKTISLFGKAFGGNDLFLSVSKNSNTSKLSEKPLSLFDNNDSVSEEKSKLKDGGKENGQENILSASAASETLLYGNSDKKLPIDIKSQTTTTTALFGEKSDGNDLFKSVSKSNSVVKVHKQKTEEEQEGIKSKIESRKEADQKNNLPLSTTDAKDTEKALEEASPFVEESDGSNLFKSISKSSGMFKPSDKKQDIAADEKEIKKPPTGSPGKLKHNLNINVNALMPGAAPPKLREMTKSQSLDLPKEQTLTPTQPLSPDVGFFTPPVPLPRKDGSTASSEKVVSFEDALDNIEVLHSVTKDRAKIPIKRRPSTRRGRRQAIQSGPADSTAADEVNDGNVVEPAKVESPALAPEIVQGIPKENLSVTPPPLQDVQNETHNILDDIKNDKKRLVASKTLAEEKPKSSIFESEDSDSDLFGAGLKKEAPKKITTGKKKSLFNDSSSEEDLFSGIGRGGFKRKESTRKAIEKKPQKPSATRKLENIEPDEDPLSSLLK